MGHPDPPLKGMWEALWVVTDKGKWICRERKGVDADISVRCGFYP